MPHRRLGSGPLSADETLFESGRISAWAHELPGRLVDRAAEPTKRHNHPADTGFAMPRRQPD